jgi:hypothetical protein
MATSTFDRLAEEIKTLTPDEQVRLRDLLNRALQDELARRLLAEGVISRIPPPITDFTPYRNRKRIEIKGKPLSETIIEERR